MAGLTQWDMHVAYIESNMGQKGGRLIDFAACNIIQNWE